MPEVAFGKWDKTQHMESSGKTMKNANEIWSQSESKWKKSGQTRQDKKEQLPSVQIHSSNADVEIGEALFLLEWKFHADNSHFSFLSCWIHVHTYTCDENGFYSLPLYPCRLFINSGSSTVRSFSHQWMLYVSHRTSNENVRYVIAHHLVIINTFTSFHSITAASSRNFATYPLVVYTLCLCIWIDSLYTFVKKTYQRTVKRANHVTNLVFSQSFPYIAYNPITIYVLDASVLPCSALSRSLSLSSFLFSTFLPLTLLGYVNLYASMLLISSWRTVFIISFGLFSTRLVVVQLVFSTKFYKWCDSHLYLGPFSGVKWMNATWHTVVSIFTLTLSIYFCRQKRQNMKLNRSKIRITTGNLPDTFCILINLSYWISEQTKAWKRTVIMKTRDP